MGEDFYESSRSGLQDAINEAKDNYEADNIYICSHIYITYGEVDIDNVDDGYSITIMTRPGYSTKTIYCNNVNPNGFCIYNYNNCWTINTTIFTI